MIICNFSTKKEDEKRINKKHYRMEKIIEKMIRSRGTRDKNQHVNWRRRRAVHKRVQPTISTATDELESGDWNTENWNGQYSRRRQYAAVRCCRVLVISRPRRSALARRSRIKSWQFLRCWRWCCDEMRFAVMVHHDATLWLRVCVLRRTRGRANEASS